MKNRFEVAIGDVEGLEYGLYEYKVTLNTMEQYLYDTDTFELQGDGNFSFAVLQNNFILGGFTIPISALTKCSKRWFPLANPFVQLPEMPEKPSGPQISISVKPLGLYSVAECSESSIESPLFSPRVIARPNVLHALRQELVQKDSTILKLEDICNKAKTENSRLQNIVDELAENFYKYQSENKDRMDEVLNENSELKERLLKVEADRLRGEEEVLRLTRQLEVVGRKAVVNEDTERDGAEIEVLMGRLKESEGKRKELQQVLNSANTQWIDVKASNHTLQYLEKENKSLISKVKELSQQAVDNLSNAHTTEDMSFMKQMHSLSIKVTQTKQKNSDLKQQLQTLEAENTQYKDIIERFRNDLSKQTEENSELSEQLKVALCKIPHREEKVDLIDKALKKFFKDSQMKNPFVKISEGVYNYGNKRLCFNLKNGLPVVRVGGGYMFVDEFLRMYNTHYKKKDDTPRSQSLEGKSCSTSRLKQKIEIEQENKLNETDSPGNKNKLEIKILKKAPRRVFIP